MQVLEIKKPINENQIIPEGMSFSLTQIQEAENHLKFKGGGIFN